MNVALVARSIVNPVSLFELSAQVSVTLAFFPDVTADP